MDNIIELKQNEVAVVTGGCDLFGIGEITGAFIGISFAALILYYIPTPTGRWQSDSNFIWIHDFSVNAIFTGSLGFTIGRLIDISICAVKAAANKFLS